MISHHDETANDWNAACQRVICIAGVCLLRGQSYQVQQHIRSARVLVGERETDRLPRPANAATCDPGRADAGSGRRRPDDVVSRIEPGVLAVPIETWRP